MIRQEITVWHDRPVAEWQELWGVPGLRVFRTVGSTSDVARELADADAAEGTLVIADEQTRGRGRRGRSWHAPRASGLLMSMVLRPRGGSETVLSLRLGMAAARAIETVLPLKISIKWPNDLLVRERKVGGILCEGSFEAGAMTYLVAGVGLNLCQRHDDWPPELAGLASSLSTEAGVAVDPPRLAGRVVTEWLAAAASRSPTLEPDELAAFHSRDALHGRSITIDGREGGTAVGLTDAGGLRVLDKGLERVVVSGTVRAIHQPSRDPA